jgi:phosphate transport system substrate-binding protein
MTVQWPNSGDILAAPLSDGVAATIKQIPGAIGYPRIWLRKVDQHGLRTAPEQGGQLCCVRRQGGCGDFGNSGTGFPPAGLDRRSSKAPTPIRSPRSPGFLAYKKQDPKKAEWMRKLVEYCVTTGQSISDSMGYIPLPENVAAKVKTAAAQIQ